MILCNITFEVVTEESTQHGEAEESGFISENEPFTFRELVEWMRGGEPSSYPRACSIRDWVTQDQGETREFFEHGARESRSIHFARENAARKEKYWIKALRAAGLTRA